MTEGDMQKLENAKNAANGVLATLNQPALKPSDIQTSLRNLAVAVVSICEIVSEI